MWLNSSSAKNLAGLDISVKPERSSSGREEPIQVVHGCRQLVPWCWVKSRRRSTPPRVASIQLRHSRGTAGVKPEERRGRRQSSCPSCLGRTRATMAGTTGCPRRRILKPAPVRIAGCNRLREAGLLVIADAARRGEYVPGPCTPPVTPPESSAKPPAEPRKGGGRRGVEGGGEVVTKSAVPEGAAGSPPF